MIRIVHLRAALLLAILSCALSAPKLHAQAGVLLPRDKEAPNPAVLSLEEMSVDITVDDGDARVRLTQIFLNHTDRVEEATYRFPLGSAATISDFAVWDGAVRIPAIVLERRRAEAVYNQARAQAIDPGLLQMGERSGDDEVESTLFTAKITPIPAFGTKRLELEYHQRLEATAMRGGFVMPVVPDAGGTQSVHTFHVHISMHSSHAYSDLKLLPGYSYTVQHQDAHGLEATFSGKDVALTSNLGASWTFDPVAADTLSVITHRDPSSIANPPDSRAAQPKPASEPGFFQASVLLADSAPATASHTAPPKTFILLFDTSLSMQWEKLERSFAATEAVLRGLTPQDRFNLIAFNQQSTLFAPSPQPADRDHIESALIFLKSSRLRGGTDLGKALAEALVQATQPDTSILLFTDGGSNRGNTVLPARIAATYAQARRALPHPPNTDVFAVGNDANLPLLKQLAREDGVLEHVLSTEPLDLHLQAFIGRIARTPVGALALDAPFTQMVYPLQDTVFPGSTASWVGQYAQPATVKFTMHGVREGQPLTTNAAAVSLPAIDAAHPQLPRLWAQARVDALLDQINRDGESRAVIDEIIRLARRYKLVTPYTSFLAVPRSLLRPRVIRPGDPVLRVRTDTGIASVIAVFPFGLTKELRHLASEDMPDHDGTGGLLWETRFLAPETMHDGTYNVRLLLRDRHGNLYRENKSFVIASTPPVVRIVLPTQRLHRGQQLLIRASASQSTRTLTARMPGIASVDLRWNAAASVNTGTLLIPQDMPVGVYKLSVTAEDVAHNLGSQEVPVEVVP